MGKKSKKNKATGATPKTKTNDLDDDLYSQSKETISGCLMQPKYSTESILRTPCINGDAQFLLFEAAKYNLVDRMHDLVFQHNANVNQTMTRPSVNPDRIGWMVTAYPLSYAVISHNLRATQWLLENGANVDAREFYHPPGRNNGTTAMEDPDSITPLWYACQFGNVRIAKLLIDANADVNSIKQSTGFSPLLISVQNGHKAVISLLLQSAANIELGSPQRGGTYQTPLVTAVVRVQLDIVAQLISFGANLSALPSDIRMFLMATRYKGESQVGDVVIKVTPRQMDQLDKLLMFTNDKASFKDLKKNSTYKKACAAELKGNYRKTLRHLRDIPSELDCLQLQFDIERNMEAIFGCKGSDARVSLWNQVPPGKGKQPKNLQFLAQTQRNRIIYTHGGLDFIAIEQNPHINEVWGMNIDTLIWTKVKTTGSSPGARCGHTMFAYQDSLYVWGGKQAHQFKDSKLYRLTLTSDYQGKWELVKTKGSAKPQPREDHAGVLYRDKYYIHGGQCSSGSDFTDDLWCLDLLKLKWNCLQRGLRERKCHKMWAANWTLYCYAGVTHSRTIKNIHVARQGLEDLCAYDIASNTWKELKVVGEHPYSIAEYTVLPLYHGDDEDEPSSVIVWGGYSEGTKNMGILEAKKKHLIAKHGEEDVDAFLKPYRNRMYRFDIDSESWIHLKSSISLLPTAQSLAAQLESNDGHVKILIARGYGLNTNSSYHDKVLPYEANVPQEAIDNIVEARGENWREKNAMPALCNNIYEVYLADERDICKARDDLVGKGWAWTFYDMPGEHIPKLLNQSIFPSDPSLHIGIDLTYEDFIEQTDTLVQPNNDEKMLGLRVLIGGLKGRKDLNGQIGRCGYWDQEKCRYQVFIPPYQEKGPLTVAVKPSNLSITSLSSNGVESVLKKQNLSSSKLIFPSISLSLGVPQDIHQTQGVLKAFLYDSSQLAKKELMICTDHYYGPVSIRAQVMMRTIAGFRGADKSFARNLSICCVNSSYAVQNGKKDVPKELALLHQFYSKALEEDSLRVQQYEEYLLKPGRKIFDGEKLHMTVTIDSIEPKITRKLIISADLTLQNLHQQVLCPAIGWTKNYHCYAFRREYGPSNILHHESFKSIPASEKGKYLEKNSFNSIKMMGEECWIGPQKTTAIDTMFQPLYIGGKLANDQIITLRDLFVPDEDGNMYLQYVYDFGDWWSHRILLTRFDGEFPSDATNSVAYLKSGENACPPEDIHGMEKYCTKFMQLSGTMEYEEVELNPSNEKWWGLFNNKIRGKHNMSTFNAFKPLLDFDLDDARRKLDIAIRNRSEEAGNELLNMTQSDLKSGVTTTNQGIDGTSKRKKLKPTEKCAVCGVTVALKICSGCHSVAFCSREHQIQFWPNHKVECKRIQKENEAKN